MVSFEVQPLPGREESVKCLTEHRETGIHIAELPERPPLQYRRVGVMDGVIFLGARGARRTDVCRHRANVTDQEIEVRRLVVRPCPPRRSPLAYGDRDRFASERSCLVGVTE